MLEKSANSLHLQTLRSSSGEKLKLSYSTLVPEDNFRNLLNSDGEVIVNDTLYKITPSGTFFAAVTEKDLLRKHADILDLEHATRINENTLKWGNVYLFETFKNINFENDLEDDSDNNLEEDDLRTTPFNIPYPPIDQFPKEKASRKTWAGKLLQGLGFRKSIIAKLPSNRKRRLNCAVFDYNYVIKHSIGVTAKVQKKIWHGGWTRVKNWGEGHIQVGYRNVLVRYNYPSQMDRVKSNLMELAINSGRVPQEYRDHVKQHEYIMQQPYPDWFNKIIATVHVPIIHKSIKLTYKDVYKMLIPKLKKIVLNAKNPGSADDGRFDYYSPLKVPTTLSLEEKEYLSRVPHAMPIYAEDGIYMFYTAGVLANTNRKKQGEVTLRFSEGTGTFMIGVNITNFSAPKFRPTYSIKDAEQTGTLLGGEFFAGAYDGQWTGFNLEW